MKLLASTWGIELLFRVLGDGRLGTMGVSAFMPSPEKVFSAFFLILLTEAFTCLDVTFISR